MSAEDSVRIIEYDCIDESQFKEKLKLFAELFKSRTNTNLSYIVRAPGRVNLIGDHIDYHGFAVLPMAIENSIWLGCSFVNQGDGINQIRLFNQESGLFPDFIHEHSFDLGRKLDQSHEWQNYILCGYHGVLLKELLQVPPKKALQHAKSTNKSGDLSSDSQESIRLKDLFQFNVLIQSDLPQASGLSSSSALVCASAVASHLLLHESNLSRCSQLDSKQLAEDCSRFEHLVGTHGGGMDQAVILTAHRGYAKYVEFIPNFSCSDVQLLDNVAWLISHCGSDYPKAATAGFNSRVFETRLGAAMIAKALGASDIALDKTITLGKVRQSLLSGKSIEQILEILRDKVFPKEVFSLNEVCDALQLSEDELLDRFGTTKSFLDTNFKDCLLLRKRCEHVFEEADRVRQFIDVCDTSKDPILLGKLMTQSHYSLRDKYECSHIALDNLVDVSLKAGAFGARVTGAGWGGCIVTLVGLDKCSFVLEELKKVSRFTMRTEPRSGSTIIKF